MSEDNGKITLSPKSIGALADELETRWSRNSQTGITAHNPGGARRERKNGKSFFLWGAASGIGFALFAPFLSQQARPALREIVKGGIKAGRYVTKLSSQIKEDVEDLAAEAKADLDKEKPA